MKTPQTDDIARGNHVVPVEWAQQLERERDEAVDDRKNSRQSLLFALEELDEAKNDISGWKNKWECAVTMAAKAENERDEAREEVRRLKIILDLIKKEAQ